MASLALTGYRRENGSLGIRNTILVMSITGLTGPAARQIGEAVADVHVISMPYGTGLVAQDRETHLRALEGMACNPNVAAVLLISDHAPKLENLLARISDAGQRVEGLLLDAHGHDHEKMVLEGIRISRALYSYAARQERGPASISDLCVGLKCGRSDPSSGLVANPVVGRFVDRLVDEGGTAIFGEVVEWLGAEHLLSARAADEGTRNRLIELPRQREEQAVAAGLDLMGNNPSPTNIASGLSTIEEKSLGGISKTGTRPISGVLDYAQAPDDAGLFAMNTPNYAPEHLSGLSAAGCQLHLFTTGAGNPFVNGLCPTLKISANSQTCARLKRQIDVDLSGLLAGKRTHEEGEAQLSDAVRCAINGEQTWGEKNRCGDDVISRFGAAL